MELWIRKRNAPDGAGSLEDRLSCLESAPDIFIRWCEDEDDEQNTMHDAPEDDSAKRVQFGRECITVYTIQLTVADMLTSAGV